MANYQAAIDLMNENAALRAKVERLNTLIKALEGEISRIRHTELREAQGRCNSLRAEVERLRARKPERYELVRQAATDPPLYSVYGFFDGVRVKLDELYLRDVALTEVERLKGKWEKEGYRCPQCGTGNARLVEERAKIDAALAEIQEQRKRVGLPSTGPTPPGVLAMALRLIEEALKGE